MRFTTTLTSLVIALAAVAPAFAASFEQPGDVYARDIYRRADSEAQGTHLAGYTLVRRGGGSRAQQSAATDAVNRQAAGLNEEIRGITSGVQNIRFESPMQGVKATKSIDTRYESPMREVRITTPPGSPMRGVKSTDPSRMRGVK